MLCVNNYCSAHEPLLVLGINDYWFRMQRTIRSYIERILN